MKEFIDIERVSFTITEPAEGLMHTELHGILDAYNSNEFGKIMARFYEQGKFTNMTFECSGMSYMASTGVGIMTHMLRLVKQNCGNMIMINMQHKVHDVLQLLGFSQFFEFSESLAEAISKLGVECKDEEEEVIAEAELEPLFPVIVQCPHCGKKLRAPRAMRARCTHCKSIITINEDGEVK